VLWVVIGYSLAFTEDSPWIGGTTRFALEGLFYAKGGQISVSHLAPTIPESVFMMFQMMFAIITPALITGATADRLKFKSWVVLLGLWSLLVYSPVAHWVFSPTGWLFKRGALDFAGGTVVHINAGVAALAIILIIGKRRGYPNEPMPPHSLPWTLIGTGILWFGWFGFNAGSALSAGTLASQALINTHMAAAAAMLGWLIVEKLRDGHATTLGGASGAVAGLVAITPCAGFVSVMPALLIGFLAGVICYLAIGLKRSFGFDDALDVVAVHLVGGITGSLLLGFFADTAINAAGHDGVFNGGGGELLGNQAVAVLATLVFSFVVTFVIAKVIDMTWGLRVDEAAENEGLDLSQHAETAYS
jgi:Amt family ammonium transporter